MSASLPFPSVAPYRIDQVTAAPLAMTGLFLGQLALAGLISWSVRRGWHRVQHLAAVALVLSVALFFTLASWGTSDPAVLSHHLGLSLDKVRGEPFWMAMRPLIVRLPWRMSLVHGLVVSGYALLALLLARHWRCPVWGGWWVLLICCSPMLRYFLQNGVSRQALLSLLLVPLMLAAARLARPHRTLLIGCTTIAATVHSAFFATLGLVLLPRLLVTPLATSREALVGLLRGRRGVAVAGAAILVLVLALPLIASKLSTYLWQVSYVNNHPIAVSVQHLQMEMAIGVLLGCWTRRLGPQVLFRCGHTRVLMLFALLYALLQQSIAAGWLAQISIRFADPVGLFLLISWLGWLVHYRCLWAVVPALLLTLQVWLVERLIASNALACGRNDEFLCVPDRWPWLLRY
jgi:hypothetical protein